MSNPDYAKITQDALTTGVFATRGMRIVRSERSGKPVFFAVDRPKDVIQKHHIAGEFYEAEELDIIARHCPKDAVFCDIGANVGNHSLYAAKFLNVSKVLLFEVNPEAIRLLIANMFLNGVADRCNFDHLGFGVGANSDEGYSVVVEKYRNLGGGQMVAGSGEISLRSADAMIGDQPVDFVKIDVEGMEMDVLAGMKKTIARDRPVIFVEVDNKNRPQFEAWVAQSSYKIVEQFQRYKVNENFLLVSG